MIITLSGVFLIIIGIMLYKLNDKLSEDQDLFKIIKKIFHIKQEYYYNELVIPAVIIAFIGSGILFICLLLIIFNHINIDHSIKEYNLSYDILNKRIEVVNSNIDGEDMSTNDVMKDIEKWNQDTLSQRHFSKSLFTNWFYDKDYVENTKFIDLDTIIIKKIEEE